jgi:TolB-like protein
MNRTLGLHLFVIALLYSLVGCGSGVRHSFQTDSRFIQTIRIAILPLDNLSGRDKAGEKVTEYLFQSLSRHNGIQVTESGLVYDVLRRNRIRSTTILTDQQIDTLSSALGVTHILTGSVLDYSEQDNQYLGKVPTVAFTIRLVDVSTRQTVMTASANDRGDRKSFLFGIGSIKSSDLLTRKLADDVANRIAARVGK